MRCYIPLLYLCMILSRNSHRAASSHGTTSGSISIFLLLFVSLTTAIALPPPAVSPPTTPNLHVKPFVRRAVEVDKSTSDPAKFDWIHRWAAIGDRFTAGIGAGHQMGMYLTDAWKCSRYSLAWPVHGNKGLGPAVQDFQFPACSGARTEGIRQQAALLTGNLDLVLMTAGGNDLCLAAIIKECVFLPYKGEQVCQDVLDKAQLNINTILKPNLETILDELDSKIKDDAILVFNGYAPFFNTENEDCADRQKHDLAYKEWWGISYWTQEPLPLSITRRTKFNTLVSNINKAIKEVVEENDGIRPYRIVYGDWSSLPAKVDGQMCSPRSTGHYPDPEQEGLLFFKPDTHVHEGHIGMRKRSDNETLSDEQRAFLIQEEEEEAKQRAKLEEEREMYAREMKQLYPHNPLNFKFGGKYTRGEATFEIIPNWFARPIVKRHEGRCNSHYYFSKSKYVVVGNGWGNAPIDQNAISTALIRCGAFMAHSWDWKFCHPNDREPCEGYEWKWVLETAPLIKARCFDNLKVAKAGGGYYHKY